MSVKHLLIRIFIDKNIYKVPDDVLDGNAIRLAPFRRDRLTYGLDELTEALGILRIPRLIAVNFFTCQNQFLLMICLLLLF